MKDVKIKYWGVDLVVRVYQKSKYSYKILRFLGHIPYTKFYTIDSNKYNFLFEIKGDILNDVSLSKDWWRQELKKKFDEIDRKKELLKLELI